MAFEFELEEDFEAPHQEHEDTWVIDIALGYDAHAVLAVVMSVILVQGDSYLEGSISNAFDLQFGIRQRFLESASELDFSKEVGRRYIPSDRNKDVLAAIRSAAIQLVSAVRPEHLTMETYHPHLEPKALRKYEDICADLSGIGYEVAAAFREPSNGINYWYLRRQ